MMPASLQPAPQPFLRASPSAEETMTQTTPALPEATPRWVPALLSFAAGYVDSYTFLGLFGLFVAQVTGSFVTAGAQFIIYDAGFFGKMLAVLAFFLATALTAVLIGVATHKDRDALPWMLGLETLLLVGFAALMLAGPPVKGPDDWHGFLPGVLAAMAMGTQSVIVRLLMRGIPQTNVMTGNMTQLGVETTEIIRAWRRCAREPDDQGARGDFVAIRARLLVVLSIAIGFIVGAFSGAAAYSTTGMRGIPLAVVLLAALTLWAMRRRRAA
jgi:uncharacterized membrane protein YoaK (UPF0700 family)